MPQEKNTQIPTDTPEVETTNQEMLQMNASTPVQQGEETSTVDPQEKTTR